MNWPIPVWVWTVWYFNSILGMNSMMVKFILWSQINPWLNRHQGWQIWWIMGELFAVMKQDVSLAISGYQWEEDQEQWNIPSTILFGNLGHNQLWLFHYFLTKWHSKNAISILGQMISKEYLLFIWISHTLCKHEYKLCCIIINRGCIIIFRFTS